MWYGDAIFFITIIGNKYALCDLNNIYHVLSEEAGDLLMIKYFIIVSHPPVK